MRIALAMLVASALILPASAHHGFTGRYDAGAPVWVSGVIRSSSFGWPHPTLVVAVEPGAMGEVDPPPSYVAAPPGPTPLEMREASIEFPPVRAFFALAGTLRDGDRVELIALRNCLAPHQLRSQWVRLPNGETIAPDVPMSSMVDGCG